MSYQSLNIIGSLTAGVPQVQVERQANRDRVEAYRSLMKDQVSLRNRLSTDDVDAVADRMVVGDSLEEKQNPYSTQDQGPTQDQDHDSSEKDDESESAESNPGGKLDLLI